MINRMRKILITTARGSMHLHGTARHTRGTPKPLIQNYKNSWPDTEYFEPAEKDDEFVLPPRTVKDSVLRFKLTARFDFGASLYYPHMDIHPGDFKVALMVYTHDLGLNDDELAVFLRMVGPRYNHHKREVKITCKRFPNRIENKRFAVLTLEKLLAEARKIASGALEYEE